MLPEADSSGNGCHLVAHFRLYACIPILITHRVQSRWEASMLSKLGCGIAALGSLSKNGFTTIANTYLLDDCSLPYGRIRTSLGILLLS